MSPAPVNRMLVFAFTSVAMLAGFIAFSFLVIAVEGSDATLALGWFLLFLALPSLAAAMAFLFLARAGGGAPWLATAAVFLAGVGSTFVFSGLQGMVIVLAPLATAALAVFATRLLARP